MISVIAHELWHVMYLRFEQARDRFAKHLRINLPALEHCKIDVQQLTQLLAKHIGGNCSVLIRYIHVNNIQADIKLGKKWVHDQTK